MRRVVLPSRRALTASTLTEAVDIPVCSSIAGNIALVSPHHYRCDTLLRAPLKLSPTVDRSDSPNTRVHLETSRRRRTPPGTPAVFRRLRERAPAARVKHPAPPLSTPFASATPRASSPSTTCRLHSFDPSPIAPHLSIERELKIKVPDGSAPHPCSSTPLRVRVET